MRTIIPKITELNSSAVREGCFRKSYVQHDVLDVASL